LFVLCTAALVLPVSTIAGAAVFTFTRLASTNNSSKYGEPVIFIADVLWEGSASTPTSPLPMEQKCLVMSHSTATAAPH
jgi:hypothetical protein